MHKKKPRSPNASKTRIGTAAATPGARANAGLGLTGLLPSAAQWRHGASDRRAGGRGEASDWAGRCAPPLRPLEPFGGGLAATPLSPTLPLQPVLIYVLTTAQQPSNGSIARFRP